MLVVGNVEKAKSNMQMAGSRIKGSDGRIRIVNWAEPEVGSIGNKIRNYMGTWVTSEIRTWGESGYGQTVSTQLPYIGV